MKFEDVNQEEIKNKIENLQSRVEEATELAPSRNEFEETMEKQNALEKKFKKKQISYEELQRGLCELEDSTGSVETKELTELMDILRIIGLDEKEVKEIVAHENDHCAKALSFGLETFYRIQFLKIKRENGETDLAILPSAHFHLPEDMPDDEKIKILGEIVSAPEELSIYDEKQLQ